MFLRFSTQLFLALTALLSLTAGYACRADDSMPLVYRLTASTLLQECDAAGRGTMPLHTAPAEANFTIVKTEKIGGDKYIIQFARWARPTGLPVDLRVVERKDLTSADAFYTSDGNALPVSSQTREAFYDSYYFDLNYNPSTGQERYFLISVAQLAASADVLAPSFIPIGGALIMPFKFRPQSGSDFTKDVTFSGMGGAAWTMGNRNDRSLGGMLGVGITSVTLTKENSTVTETQDRAALTFSIAALFQWQKLQVGLVGGWDILGAGNAAWTYNKKPWLAAGIGFSIFKAENATAKSAGENNGSK